MIFGGATALTASTNEDASRCGERDSVYESHIVKKREPRPTGVRGDKVMLSSYAHETAESYEKIHGQCNIGRRPDSQLQTPLERQILR